MKLRTYLDTHDMTLAEFAARVGKSIAAVSRWASGLDVPNQKNMMSIYGATNGEVLPLDFYGIAPENQTANSRTE